VTLKRGLRTGVVRPVALGRLLFPGFALMIAFTPMVANGQVGWGGEIVWDTEPSTATTWTDATTQPRAVLGSWIRFPSLLGEGWAPNPKQQTRYFKGPRLETCSDYMTFGGMLGGIGSLVGLAILNGTFGDVSPAGFVGGTLLGIGGGVGIGWIVCELRADPPPRRSWAPAQPAQGGTTAVSRAGISLLRFWF
jgi:hypothetical protein